MFLRTAERYAEDVEVVKIPGEGFVEIVENDLEHTAEARATVRRVVEPLRGKGVDKIVLGCTHYPFLREAIAEALQGENIDIIDSGEAVARRVEWLLERYNIKAPSDAIADLKFITFADEEYRLRLERKAKSIDL
jgi:glutamate racemase